MSSRLFVGVPQGTIWAPLLHTLYPNFLSRNLLKASYADCTLEWNQKQLLLLTQNNSHHSKQCCTTYNYIKHMERWMIKFKTSSLDLLSLRFQPGFLTSSNANETCETEKCTADLTDKSFIFRLYYMHIIYIYFFLIIFRWYMYEF